LGGSSIEAPLLSADRQVISQKGTDREKIFEAPEIFRGFFSGILRIRF
jgi:hypothetical protein